MKKITTLLVLLVTTIILAQAPQKMSYQAVLRNTNNSLITNTTVGMRISILQGSETGTAVYVETQTPTTNTNGLVSLEIGSGTSVTGAFSAIDWASGNYFVKIETAPTGGTNYTITSASQLLSVPYALYSTTSGISSPSAVHYVGELYAGGIIVSVWKESGIEHGIIASLTDLSAGIIWTTSNNQSMSVPGIGAFNPRDGLANSNAIVAQAGAGTNYAAGLCRAYVIGGYTDWYLPATWELNQCYNSALIVNQVLGDTNGFKFNSYYWSSNEDQRESISAGKSAVSHSFFDGSTDYKGYGGANKNSNDVRVRAVRRF
jgi:hypothetical protein